MNEIVNPMSLIFSTQTTCVQSEQFCSGVNNYPEKRYRFSFLVVVISKSSLNKTVVLYLILHNFIVHLSFNKTSFEPQDNILSFSHINGQNRQ